MFTARPKGELIDYRLTLPAEVEPADADCLVADLIQSDDGRLLLADLVAMASESTDSTILATYQSLLAHAEEVNRARQ